MHPRGWAAVKYHRESGQSLATVLLLCSPGMLLMSQERATWHAALRTSARQGETRNEWLRARNKGARQEWKGGIVRREKHRNSLQG
jgi:hypothetical protein